MVLKLREVLGRSLYLRVVEVARRTRTFTLLEGGQLLRREPDTTLTRVCNCGPELAVGIIVAPHVHC